MDHDLFDLFLRYRLESESALIAEALGVRETSDFLDLDEDQILSTSKDLKLKPVFETRLRRLHRHVIEAHEQTQTAEVVCPAVNTAQVRTIGWHGSESSFDMFMFSQSVLSECQASQASSPSFPDASLQPLTETAQVAQI